MWNILMINEYLSRVHNWYNKTNRFKSVIANLSQFSQNTHIALDFFHVTLIILFWFLKVIYATYRNSLELIQGKAHEDEVFLWVSVIT